MYLLRIESLLGFQINSGHFLQDIFFSLANVDFAYWLSFFFADVSVIVYFLLEYYVNGLNIP